MRPLKGRRPGLCVHNQVGRECQPTFPPGNVLDPIIDDDTHIVIPRNAFHLLIVTIARFCSISDAENHVPASAAPAST